MILKFTKKSSKAYPVSVAKYAVITGEKKILLQDYLKMYTLCRYLQKCILADYVDNILIRFVIIITDF